MRILVTGGAGFIGSHRSQPIGRYVEGRVSQPVRPAISIGWSGRTKLRDRMLAPGYPFHENPDVVQIRGLKDRAVQTVLATRWPCTSPAKTT